MIRGRGKWYDGKTSRQHEVELHLDAGALRVVGVGVDRCVPVGRLRVDPRLGKAVRAVRFPDGELLETADDGLLDHLERRQGRGAFFRQVHRWENSPRRAVIAFVLLAALSFLFVRFGIPELADRAAATFPATTEGLLGRETLQILDRTLLEPSRLPAARQRQLRRLFDGVTSSYAEREGWRLEFRSGDVVGANAFALPAGIVIVTDKLVQLAKNDQEIAGVMAHEIGHLTRRHALRHLLRNSATALLVASVTGDITSVTSLSATLPTALIDAKYSRDFENEADDAAVAYLKGMGIPTRVYADMLRRLEKDHEKDSGKGARIGELFQDHPLIEDRVNRVLGR
ncbi:M48 family metallopeptidase [Geomesophilobacter sediminis]|uniref:M48 family metallopeptidase n=1 Tax=Geomesophilobacter sediminis TaxID=2798584 RepID=A0A8J7S818_9BACT|nr:M48 family metallopeptidase [Geomesophilobacter sediminis]MBJ6727376.1 M48 family metallopeptidase [Geomesophilobacter sediminis]